MVNAVDTTRAQQSVMSVNKQDPHMVFPRLVRIARNRCRSSLSARPDLQPQLMSLPHRRIHYHKHDALKLNGLAHHFLSFLLAL